MVKGWIVAIPTYDRVEKLKKETLKTLKNQGVPNHKINIFVANKDELKKYKEAIGDDYKFIVGKKGLGRQLRFIENYYPKHQEIVRIDDDITRVINEKDKNINLSEFFTKAFKMCREKKINLWGVSKTANPFFMRGQKPITTNLVGIGGYLCGWINQKDKKYQQKLLDNYTIEDVERTILFFKNDGGILRFNHMGAKQKEWAKGGIQSSLGSNEKRKEDIKKVVKLFEKNYGEFGKIVPHKTMGYTFKLRRLKGKS